MTECAPAQNNVGTRRRVVRVSQKKFYFATFFFVRALCACRHKGVSQATYAKKFVFAFPCSTKRPQVFNVQKLVVSFFLLGRKWRNAGSIANWP